jgi:hypothetical protein
MSRRFVREVGCGCRCNRIEWSRAIIDEVTDTKGIKSTWQPTPSFLATA